MRTNIVCTGGHSATKLGIILLSFFLPLTFLPEFLNVFLRQAIKTHLRENLGNFPIRGGGQEFYRTFPKLRLGNAEDEGGGRNFVNISHLKIEFLWIKQSKNLYEIMFIYLYE